ncbi:universal stress protein [Parapedobacter koreensis]|uniref:Nucleotide-binding universal stress protein, UspA family n=1 Tax=Parapedobacter koreensis TaxID=332977 RepID=A0A1H7MFQ7_9SPHI|nr:universal stress protein [Parapedobacter koreensis]SEL09728.1 Nucleotide-binding universal stress protein, UspA family [Parapedobacter koreensis]
MNNILVPTDFSEYALKSAESALRLAQQSNATVYLFHAYTAFQSGFQSENDNERDEQRALEEAEHGMASFLKDVSGFFFDVTIKTICQRGNIVGLIRELTKEISVDLIVMSTGGATGLKYQFIGTNTYDVAESLSIPLLAVPIGAEHIDLANIAFFTDYRPEDHQTITSLYSLFGSEQINYWVVHIHEKEQQPKDEDFKKLAAYTMELQANTPIVNIDWKLVHGKENITIVQKVIDTLSGDILAITMAERNLFDRLLDKSLSKEIVMQAKIPVFIGR